MNGAGARDSRLPRGPRARRLAAWAAVLAVLGLPAARVRAGSNLLDNSPFLPPGTAASAMPEAAPLELRSIFKAGGQYEFSIYDPVAKQSTWAGLNEPGHEFLIRAFDPAHDAVTVERRGRVYRLVLKDETIIPITATAPAIVAGTAAPAGGRRLLPNNPAILRRIEAQREAYAQAQIAAASARRN